MDVKTVNVPKAGYVNASSPGVDSVAEYEGDSSRVAQTGKPQDATRPDSKAVKELSPEDTDLLTQTLNKFMESMNAELQFVVHDKTHRIMVRLVNPTDQKVIKEFPPHELLDTLAKISEYVGALLDKKA